MKKLLLIAMIGNFLLQSCATILSGSGDRVEVKSGNPAGAKVYLDGNFVGNAPNKVKVSKNSLRDGAIISINAPGHQDRQIKVTRKVMVGYVLLDVCLGLVPLGVDFLTGAIYKANPKEINYDLNSGNLSANL